MKFEWDETKNKSNIAKHGVSFEDAKRIFDGFTVSAVDQRYDYGEERVISIGMIDGIAIVLVVHTDREGVCRIISARPTKKAERKRYEKALRQAFAS